METGSTVWPTLGSRTAKEQKRTWRRAVDVGADPSVVVARESPDAAWRVAAQHGDTGALTHQPAVSRLLHVPAAQRWPTIDITETGVSLGRRSLQPAVSPAYYSNCGRVARSVWKFQPNCSQKLAQFNIPAEFTLSYPIALSGQE